MPTVIFMSLWGLGGNMILWLAAFRNVPESMLEAAKIDGANSFTRLFKIIIPMTTPIIFYNLIVGIIASLQTYGTMIMVGGVGGGGGGVDDSLLFLAVKIYETAFISMRMGYAAAISWVLFAIIALFTFIIFKFNRWVFYGEDAS
jgi:multiple sugar transport system permease protein